MAIPAIAAQGAGGGLVDSLNSINALTNNNYLRKINQVKALYAPWLTQAEIKSKNAYADLVGLQPMGKIIGNENAFLSLSDEQQDAIKNAFLRSGGRLPTTQNQNSLNNMPNIGAAPSPSGTSSQAATNRNSNALFQGFMDLVGLGNKKDSNAFNAPINQQSNQDMPPTSTEQPRPYTGTADGRVDPEGDEAFASWMHDHPDAQTFPSDYEMRQAYREKKAALGKALVEMNMTGGQKADNRTNAEKVGGNKGVMKEVEKLGEYRAEDVKNIGIDQLNLAKSGVVLNRLTDIVKNPEFQSMRDTIPGFQEKQLAVLKTLGTPEQQRLIGDFISTAEAYKAATVNSFAGKPLVREFDLADRIKINEGDTVPVAEGKLHSLTALKEIAARKNDIISDLITNKHMNQANAVKQANKMVDIKGIENEVNKSLEQRKSYTNKKTGQTRMLTDSEARALGIPQMSDWELTPTPSKINKKPKVQVESDWALTDDSSKPESFLQKLPRNIGAGFAQMGHSVLNAPHDLVQGLEEVGNQFGKRIDPFSLGKNDNKLNKNYPNLSDYIPHQEEKNFAQMLGQKGAPTFGDKLIQKGVQYAPELLLGGNALRQVMPHLTRHGASRTLREARALAADRDIGTLNVNPELIEDARQYLPNNLPERNLLEGSQHGDYNSLFNLQSNLGRVSAQRTGRIRSLFAPETNIRGEAGLASRRRLLNAIHENLQSQGHHDISDLLRQGQNEYRRYMQFRPYRNAIAGAALYAATPKNALTDLVKKLISIRGQ